MNFEVSKSQVRKVRKWIAVITIGVLVLIFGMAMFWVGGSPGSNLDESDAAACAQLRMGLDEIEAGLSLPEALSDVLDGGWPSGQPSAPVRGVFNAFRTAIAAEQNSMDGAGTLEDAAAAFARAHSGFIDVCGT